MIGPDFWARYSEVYDVLNLLPTYWRLLCDVREELGAKPGELILDVGSGTGNLSISIREHGGRVVAFDYCREVLHKHRSKGDSYGLILADLKGKLPFKDDCFDGITCNNTMYTLSMDNQKRALKELHRVLKPGGKIVLTNPRKGVNLVSVSLNVVAESVRAEGLWSTARKIAVVMPAMIKMAYYNWKLGMESKHHRFDTGEQRALLEEAGFKLVSRTKLVYSDSVVLNSACKY
jgi:ubiquinone/menaquinone biosynthesis C-methylase UbiE